MWTDISGKHGKRTGKDGISSLWMPSGLLPVCYLTKLGSKSLRHDVYETVKDLVLTISGESNTANRSKVYALQKREVQPRVQHRLLLNSSKCIRLPSFFSLDVPVVKSFRNISWNSRPPDIWNRAILHAYLHFQLSISPAKTFWLK